MPHVARCGSAIQPGLVDALLDDGEGELAWQTATTLPGLDLGERAWLRLAEERQKTHPAQALPVYWRLIDSTLETADRRAYAAAVRLLKGHATRPRPAARFDAFEARLRRCVTAIGVGRR